jgi:hypothetical protein
VTQRGLPPESLPTGGQGGWLAHFLVRMKLARERVGRLEELLTGRSNCGPPPPEAAAGPLPEALINVQALLDDEDPRVAYLQRSFMKMLESDVVALEARLNRAVGVAAPLRRREFRVLPGGRAP